MIYSVKFADPPMLMRRLITRFSWKFRASFRQPEYSEVEKGAKERKTERGREREREKRKSQSQTETRIIREGGWDKGGISRTRLLCTFVGSGAVVYNSSSSILSPPTNCSGL